MSLQSEVEEQHRSCTMQNDVLAASIQRAYNNIQDSSLANVHNRWKKVLKIIISSKGDNNCIEKYRGADDVIDLTRDYLSSDHLQSTIKAAASTDVEEDHIEEGFEDEEVTMIMDE